MGTEGASADQVANLSNNAMMMCNVVCRLQDGWYGTGRRLQRGGYIFKGETRQKGQKLHTLKYMNKG